MSVGFGVGIGDIIGVTNLAISVYKQCRDSPSQYRHLAEETHQLAKLLQSTKRVLYTPGIGDVDKATRDDLTHVGQGCKHVLQDLEARLKQHNRLGREEGRQLKSRLKWDQQAAKDLRDRLVSNVAMLSAFYNSFLAFSVFRMQQSLFSIAESSMETRSELVAIKSAIRLEVCINKDRIDSVVKPNTDSGSISADTQQRQKSEQIMRIRSNDDPHARARALRSQTDILPNPDPWLLERSAPDLKFAYRFLDAVNYAAKWQKYNMLLEIMKTYQAEKANVFAVVLSVSLLLEKYSYLIKMFESFIPPQIGLRISIEKGVTYWRLFRFSGRSVTLLLEMCNFGRSQPQIWCPSDMSKELLGSLSIWGVEATVAHDIDDHHEGGDFYNLQHTWMLQNYGNEHMDNICRQDSALVQAERQYRSGYVEQDELLDDEKPDPAELRVVRDMLWENCDEKPVENEVGHEMGKTCPTTTSTSFTEQFSGMPPNHKQEHSMYVDWLASSALETGKRARPMRTLRHFGGKGARLDDLRSAYSRTGV